MADCDFLNWGNRQKKKFLRDPVGAIEDEFGALCEVKDDDGGLSLAGAADAIKLRDDYLKGMVRLVKLDIWGPTSPYSSLLLDMERCCPDQYNAVDNPGYDPLAII